MGYTTYFDGEVTFNKPLDKETVALVNGLASTRRMKRDVQKLKERGFTGDYGVDGEFFYEDTENFGQLQTEDIVECNQPPATQSDLWLQWTLEPITDDENPEYALVWDEGEKFYSYVEWLEYLIDKIFAPRGYVANGYFHAEGEESDDQTLITVIDNVVKQTPKYLHNPEVDKIMAQVEKKQKARG